MRSIVAAGTTVRRPTSRWSHQGYVDPDQRAAVVVLPGVRFK
jgi:hypothetical protein